MVEFGATTPFFGLVTEDGANAPAPAAGATLEVKDVVLDPYQPSSVDADGNRTYAEKLVYGITLVV